jgi:DNA adenine methylase
MRYMGSKRRIAEEILPIILKGRKANQWFVEPFCGGCNITERVDGKRLANDIQPELVAMYQALQKGWKPPKLITEQEYNYYKKNKTIDPALRGYAGFTHSFGGEFFGTYRRHNDKRIKAYKVYEKGSPKMKSNYANMNYVGEVAYREALRLTPLIKDVKFVCGPYYEIDVPAKSIVYCDPPYESTRGYDSIGRFPHANFWQWCRNLKEEGHTIFISEYNAPVDFKCVWEKEVQNHLSSFGDKRKLATEKLFTL